MQLTPVDSASGGAPLPAGLTEDGSGRALWRSIVDDYTLRPDELRLLADACELADRIDYRKQRADELHREVGENLLIRGSTRQLVRNPLIDEARQELAEQRKDRIALNDLLARLKLPDLDPDRDGDDQGRDGASSAAKRSASA
ncbi:hypothetical protein [Mycobacteroides abscessus]|uniref:hypothetical protein n=1 Tax=Mycobacteroides abscessus TaxID=36809 RepID=UPI00092A6F8C|nr:hypothetical protein [Mycobacteroides abscessus]MDM2421136.1 hypothetical protein [Mycobacteroides abscessus]MDM2424733.1 hypothetical protein [Mycobacteroides abscessus]MDM2430439.1 hypothetical protein [Mycobacteroides abscessus]MDM2435300.1 hypothetical protein [Mycobacteroides abscessus]MDM2438246.1 hypothetical protein [Mycobacteroides abscessus]